jgi:MinD-like ATPase involved in chromosome partitioning or flagellar assembly
LDQATGLRRLFAGSQVFRAAGVLGPDARRNARACAELAQGLGRRGHQVLVLDEARPPYNVGGIWGVLARRTLADIPNLRLADAAMEAGPGIRLLAAPDGMHTLAGLSEDALMRMADHWGDAPEWMLVNSLGGGQGGGGASLATTADVRILVLPGDKNRLADAYAVLKSAHAAWSGGAWVVLVEGAGLDLAQTLYNSLRETALRFLGFAPDYLGCLPKAGFKDNGAVAEGLHGGLLAESLQALRTEQAINFDQCWQRMWLFSRMTVDSAGGKGGHAGRYPG